MGWFITILGEGTNTLPGEIAPRKNDPPQTNFFYFFFLKLQLKVVESTFPNPSKILKASRGVPARFYIKANCKSVLREGEFTRSKVRLV